LNQRDTVVDSVCSYSPQPVVQPVRMGAAS